ncbi:MAG: hypothetical protein MJ121_01325, partial [Clostridia bacterium]|nr:hypothetical protein [Clostridia bacterium]
AVEEAPVVEEASFDDDDDLQDLYDLLDEGEDAPAVDFVANMETVVPDFNQALAEEEPQIPAAQAEPEIPSVPVFEAPVAEEEETVDDMDEFLNSLDIDEGDSDDDEDISSLFDSLFD